MNGIGSLPAVTARIADIRARFEPPSFAPALAAAQARAAAPAEPAPVTAAAGDPGLRPFGVLPAPRPAVGPGLPPAGGAPAGAWAQRLPEAGRPWAGAIERAATSAGVRPELLAALVWAESGFRPDAVSHAGAIGLAQLMPGTAAGLGVDPHDPEQNLAGGARYLAEMLDRFGSADLALAAYNAGPARVARVGGIPDIPETRAYVPRVLGYLERLGGAR